MVDRGLWHCYINVVKCTCVIAPDVCEHVCVQLCVNPMLYRVLLCCLLLLFHCFMLLCTMHMFVDLYVR